MIDAVKHNNAMLVQTGDTDVILMLEKFQDMPSTSSSADIWITFGHGKNSRPYVNHLTVTAALHRCPALMMLHSLSRCDNLTSGLKSKGKRLLCTTLASRSYRPDN